jgi:phage terminase large subunit-like protein
MRDYTDIATNFAYDVIEGIIPACKYQKLACERFLRDLQTSEEDPDYPYEWSAEKVAHVCGFLERLPLVKGVKGTPLLKLEPWQVWLVSQAWGWICRHGVRKGYRRFSMAYTEVPRGNGKSALSSGLSLYMLAADNEPGADCYALATDERQAQIVWGDAHQMARHPKCQRLMDALGVQLSANSIHVPKSYSKFQALSGDPRTKDGLSIHWACVDELHAHPTRDLWDVTVTGAGKRDQSMIWAITTAGFDLAGVCYEQRDYLIKVLEGVVQDDALFGCIWTIDQDDDWQDPRVWQKANPNWGVSVKPDKFETNARQAIETPSKRPGFLTKHLTRWAKNTTQWLDIPQLQRATNPHLQLEDFAGKPCYIGVDLGSSSDLTAKVMLFCEKREKEINGKKHWKPHYTIFATYYLTDQALRESRNAQYKGWAEEGLLTTTEGNETDYNVLRDDILYDLDNFDVRGVGYDGWNAAQLVQELQSLGAPMIRIPQSVSTLSGPAKELDAAIRGGRFTHNDKVFVWMASNTVVTVDTNGNIKPKKENPNSPLKIDGVIAAVCAMAMQLENMIEDDAPLIALI